MSKQKKLIDEFNKLCPVPGLVDARTILDESPAMFIDTGNEDLNKALGNKDGIPTGKIVEIFGPESTGKSAISYWLLGLWQEVGGVSILADIVEDSFDEEWAAKLGIDMETLIYLTIGEKIKKRRGKDSIIEVEGMEDLLEKIEITVRASKVATPEDPVLIVWDDIASTPTRKELEGEYGSDQPALQARALSKGLRKLYSVMHDSLVTLVCINQLRDTLNSYGARETTVGGRALKFYSSVRTRISVVGKKDTQKETSIQTKVKNFKNKVGVARKETYLKIDADKGIVL